MNRFQFDVGDYFLPINRLFMVCLLVIAVLTPYPCEANDEDAIYQGLLERIARQLDVSTVVADRFLERVDKMAIIIQNNFEEIASHTTSDSRKQELAKFTISEFFASPDAMIQVSSLRKGAKIIRKRIEDYFKHLQNLSRRRYRTVEVYFDKNYFSLGDIEPFYENDKKSFDFSVTMWQIFIGCRDVGSDCYKDATKKSFHMVFRYESNVSQWKFRVKAITVEDTVSFEEFDQTRRRWVR
jgi:hypothetical protein